MHSPAFDVEAEPGRELHRPQKAHRILAEADVGVADGAHAALLDVVQAADVVDDLARLDIVEQAVHGEVAAAGVLFGGAEDVVAVDVQVLAPRRARGGARTLGGFGHLVLARAAAEACGGGNILSQPCG